MLLSKGVPGGRVYPSGYPSSCPRLWGVRGYSPHPGHSPPGPPKPSPSVPPLKLPGLFAASIICKQVRTDRSFFFSHHTEIWKWTIDLLYQNNNYIHLNFQKKKNILNSKNIKRNKYSKHLILPLLRVVKLTTLHKHWNRFIFIRYHDTLDTSMN